MDSSILTFANHGCNGTYNIGTETQVNESTAHPNKPIETLNGKIHAGSTSIFDPVIDRHLFRSVETSNKYIMAGDELLDNYMAFIGSEKSWESDLNDLRELCCGHATEGSVTEYEDYYDQDKRKDD